MPQIVGIKFRNSTKAYYFSPEGIDFKLEDGVIVETSRGIELGKIVIANKEVKDSDIVSPLKPVIRKANIDDQEQFDRNTFEAEKALKTAVDKLPKYNLDLKFVDVEYTFDRKKIIFYFTAPGRVDFREYVRDLGATFKTRIELRQIHERDDFKMKGALAACGRPCCCSAHLHEFEKVSIKMAKVQGLSLNPQKISGLCGKLMCCLKYEQDYYKEMGKIMPKEGSFVMTPDGEGRVEANDMLRQRCRVKVVRDDGVLRNYYNASDLKYDNKCGGCNNSNDDDIEDIIMLEGEESDKINTNDSKNNVRPRPNTFDNKNKKPHYNKNRKSNNRPNNN